jgi:rhamnose transport system permease protein
MNRSSLPKPSPNSPSSSRSSPSASASRTGKLAIGRTLGKGWHEMVLASLLTLLCLVAWWLEPIFMRPATQRELASHIWELALLAVPMTLILITGGIDLSVGSMMALSAVTFGLVFEMGGSLEVAAFLALLTGFSAGLLNGYFVAYVRVHPLLVTLATLAAFRGIAEGVSQARAISGFPSEWTDLAEWQLLGIPLGGCLVLGATVAGSLLLSVTPFGRYLYAIGHNATAARFSGIPVQKCRLILYSASGLAAAVAALLFVARRNTAKADIAMGMELDVITAVVLGGTSIFGGRGHVLGTMIGVLLIHELREFVSWRWNQNELIYIVVGTLLIGCVLLNNLFHRSNSSDERNSHAE